MFICSRHTVKLDNSVFNVLNACAEDEGQTIDEYVNEILYTAISKAVDDLEHDETNTTNK